MGVPLMLGSAAFALYEAFCGRPKRGFAIGWCGAVVGLLLWHYTGA
jgi:hypothetical protein